MQEHLENSEFQQNIINTIQKYFKCDYNNFDFPAKDTCYFNLYFGVFKVQIVVTPKTSYLPKSSKGYVYYGSYTWERNVKDDSFEDTCKKINEFLKEKVKQMAEEVYIVATAKDNQSNRLKLKLPVSR